jgi:hypothetical protein
MMDISGTERDTWCGRRYPFNSIREMEDMKAELDSRFLL